MAARSRPITIDLVTIYRIVVEGELSDRFVATFEDMDLERGRGETALTGDVRDQAQLQGLLARIADLGLALRVGHPDRCRSESRERCLNRALPAER